MVTEDYEKRLLDMIELPDWKVILISLVKSEEMDVWNIDIDRLSKRYYEKIMELKQQNFRISANAMLACAILLRLKARTLKMPTLQIEDEEEIINIDHLLPELQPIQRIRESGITLEDLITAIDEVMEKTDKKASKLLEQRQAERIEVQLPQYSTFDLEENIEKVHEKAKVLSENGKLVMFSSLVDNKNPEGIVNTIMPLLFLSNQGRLLMFQEEFFHEIFIRVL